MISIKHFSKLWNERYGESEFNAPVLRQVHHERWVRFYNLPGGKRYSDSAQERSEIFKRQHAIIQEIYPDDELYVITCEWTNTSRAPRSDPKKIQRQHMATFLENPSEDPEFVTYRHVYLSLCIRPSDDLDKILEAVSDDEMAGVIITNRTLDWLSHPYDGGVDVIAPSSVHRDAIAKSFADWLAID